MADKFYIERSIDYEGSGVYLTPYDSAQEAITAWFTDGYSWDRLRVLRCRNNILEYYAEVFNADEWRVIDGVLP